MRAVLIITLVLLALPAAAQAQAPPLRVKLAACKSGPPATARTATFVGSMPETGPPPVGQVIVR